MEGAMVVATWDAPDEAAIALAWNDRRQARREAELLVPSAEMYGDPDMESDQVVYHTGHEVAACRTRGRCQAMEMAKQLWWELCEAGATNGQVADEIVPPWQKAVDAWAKAEINPKRIVPPPRPEDFLTEGLRGMLEAPKPAKPTPAPAPLWRPPAPPHAIKRRLKDVERELLDWLWPGRIPLGKLTLLAGDPGLGKSFVTLDIAARVSRGEPWPDLPLLKQSPAGVVLFNAEDDLADTIAPRLDKAGADDGNIVAVEGVAEGGRRRHFSLEADLPRLEEVMQEMPDARLVVIDPISAYTGSVDSHKNTDVRGLLAPLADLAGRHRVAIVAVTHLSKSGGAKAVYRAMGSLAFAAASRAVWAVAKDQENPERRLFLPGKLNLARDPDGLAYRIVDSRVAWELEPVRMHADEAFAAELKSTSDKSTQGAERREVVAWLRNELAEGRQPSKQVIADARENGFSERTLRRAFKEIEGRSKKDGGKWYWSLPDQDGHQDCHQPPSQ
ncbi:AAA family ATPase [Bremerella volcania]|nr:AAA family ATPase [Bremerella volcania]